MPFTPEIEAVTVEYLEPSRVERSIGRKIGESRSLNGLLEHAKENQRFELKEGSGNVFGLREEFRPRNPIQPPEARRGAMGRTMRNISGPGAERLIGLPDMDEDRRPVEKLDYTLMVQDLSGDDAAGALVTTSLSDGRDAVEYHFMLETPGNDILNTREFTWDQGEVVEALSWWSRFLACIRDCGCGWTLVSCWSWSWSDLLACVVSRCGTCPARCGACATCRCRWWCRWASGCCRD